MHFRHIINQLLVGFFLTGIEISYFIMFLIDLIEYKVHVDDLKVE